VVISAAVGCSPALTNSMALFYEQRCLEWLIPLNMMFSYRLQDLVVAAAVAHLSQGFRAAAENMRIPLSEHSWQAGDSTSPPSRTG